MSLGVRMIGAVAKAAWMNLRRDRAALMLSFAVPIVFFSIFASVFGAQGRAATRRITLAVVDEDQSERSRRLVAALVAETSLKALVAAEGKPDAPPASPFDAAAAEHAVRSGDLSVALVIPKGFGAAEVRFGPANGTPANGPPPPKLLLLADTSDPIAPEVVKGLLQKVVFTGPAFLSVEVRDVLGETKKSPMVAFYAAGIGVMFLLFTASSAGGALLDENESGTLDRILTTRVTMTVLLLGKLVYIASLGLLQLCVMFLWGAAVFGLDLFSHLPGFTVMALTTVLTTAAFGLVLAALCRSRAQLGAVSTLVILSISAVGGSMFPRFLMPEGLQRFGLVAFNAWALEGFVKVFWREEPLRALLPEVVVLLLWAAIFFALARRLARRWETV